MSCQSPDCKRCAWDHDVECEARVAESDDELTALATADCPFPTHRNADDVPEYRGVAMADDFEEVPALRSYSEEEREAADRFFDEVFGRLEVPF